MKALLTALVLLGCSPSETTSIRVLKDAGYTDIRLDGHEFFACSDDDTLTMAFRATGPSGRPVTGSLCCGVLKSCTVRLD